MKNIITIDYDSERENSIKIAKPEDQKVADDNKEAYNDMIMDDMSTLSKGLATLIKAAEEEGIMDRGKALENCVDIIKNTIDGIKPLADEGKGDSVDN